jgi:hypothetical protein
MNLEHDIRPWGEYWVLKKEKAIDVKKIYEKLGISNLV